MYKDIILKILVAIDYEEDKEAFADEFLKALHAQALVKLFETLPTERREEVKQAFVSIDTTEKATLTLKEYFTDEQIQQALNQTAQRMLTDWMKALDSSLTDEQGLRLAALFEELQQTAQTPDA
jgi:predicted ArsR family transcriptional regulator